MLLSADRVADAQGDEAKAENEEPGQDALSLSQIQRDQSYHNFQRIRACAVLIGPLLPRRVNHLNCGFPRR